MILLGHFRKFSSFVEISKHIIHTMCSERIETAALKFPWVTLSVVGYPSGVVDWWSLLGDDHPLVDIRNGIHTDMAFLNFGEVTLHVMTLMSSYSIIHCKWLSLQKSPRQNVEDNLGRAIVWKLKVSEYWNIVVLKQPFTLAFTSRK